MERTTNEFVRPGDDSMPSYAKTKAWLLDYISEKKLGPGDKMPSERMLAEALGLSRPTIARAIVELVDEGVLSRAKRVGTYVGNYTARKLGKRLGTAAIVMPFLSEDPSSPMVADLAPDRLAIPYRRDGMSLQVLQGAMAVLKQAGFRLVIHSNRQLADELEVLHNLPKEGIDGAIIMPHTYSDEGAIVMPPAHDSTPLLYANIVKNGLPVVLVDRYLAECPADHVVTDNFGGAKQAVEYLISLGHKRIAHFTDFGELTSTMDRERGYRAALEDAGIAYEEELVCGPHLLHNKKWSFLYALEHCLHMPQPITAVFCLNDDTLLLALREAQALGLRIPEEFAIAGFFDDSIPAGMQVPFTRMVQAKVEMGRVAAELLIDRIWNTAAAESRHVSLPAELKPAGMF